MRKDLLLTIGIATLLAACNQPTAPAVDEPVVADTPIMAPAMPAATDLPTDRTTAEQRAEMAAEAAKAGVQPVHQIRGDWRCDNDETIELRFFPDQGVAVMVRDGQNIEMQSEPVAAGYKYSSGPTSIEGRGDALTMTTGVEKVNCVPA